MINVKQLPIPTEISQPFWDGLNQNEIYIQQCGSCSSWVHYPRSNCPSCLSNDLEWKRVSGNGILYAYTVSHVPTLAEFSDDVPQLLAVIQLDEGVHLNSVMSGIDPAELEIDMRVAPVFFERDGEAQKLLYFTAADKS